MILPHRPPAGHEERAGNGQPPGHGRPDAAATESGQARGFFEPVLPANRPASDSRTGGQPPAMAARPAETRPAESVPASAAAAKLDQIKDLYLTAEAIGEDALARHFEQVSERQRQLIKEYFEEAASGSADS